MAEIKGGNQPMQQGKAATSAPAEETRLYTVRGPGAVAIGGQLIGPGTELQLTSAQAESLGSNVFPGRAKPPDVVANRRAGKYAVAEGHSLWHEGKLQGPGFALDLEADEARKLGETIEPVA